MALKSKYKLQDDIPEGLSNFYVEQAGEYVLQVDGMVPKATVDDFRNNNIKLNKDLESLQNKLNGVDIEEYQQLKTERQKMADQELIDAGQLDKVVLDRTERMRNDYESKLEAHIKSSKEAIQKASEYEQEFNSMIVENKLKDAAVANGVRPEALPDIMARGKRVWKRTEGQRIAAFDGETPIYGKKSADPLSVNEWFEELGDKAPHLFKSSSGSGATGGEGRGAVRRLSRSDQQSMNNNLEAIAAGKVQFND